MAESEMPSPPPSFFKVADSLLYSVALFNLVAVWRIQDLFPILGKIKLPILIQLVMLGLFLFDSDPRRKVEWIKSPILYMILGILGIMVLGLPTSLWPGKGLTFLIRDFLPSTILMVVMATSVRDESDLKFLTFIHLGGAFLYSFMVFKNFEPGDHGRLGSLIYYDSNDLSLLIACTIPFAIYFLRTAIPTWQRLFSLGTLLLFLVMLIKSGSRGGLLGFIGVMVYILFRYQAVPARLRAGAAVGGILALAFLGGDRYWEMMGTILDPKDDYNLTEDSGRSAVWKRGLGYMISNPVLGVGVRAFPQAEGMLSDLSKEYAARGQSLKWSVAHNSFVEIGAELGVGGLLLFLGFIGYTFAYLRKIGKRTSSKTASVETNEDAAYAQMLIGSLIGFCICGFFISAEYMTLLYVLMAFVLGQKAILERRRAFFRKTISRPGDLRKGPTKKNPATLSKPREPYVHWSPSGS